MADKKLPKKDAEATPDPVATKTDQSSKFSFLRRKRNRILLAALTAIIVILVILIPVLKLVVFKEPSQEQIAELEREATRYSVVPSNFADPSLIEVNGTFYAFATRSLGNDTINIQVASTITSDGNISDWNLHADYDALPNLPEWVKHFGDAGVWAPVVSQRPNGTFVMMYAALHKDHPRRHCLGVATSNSVLGPYYPAGQEPLLCHISLGGIIDPTIFQDPVSENDTYVIYKNDGNAIGSGGACANGNWPNTPTTFQWDLMNSSWTGLQGVQNQTAALNTINNATKFMRNNKVDGPNIEAPMMWYREYKNASRAEPKRAYHLLYNAGCFADETYRIEHVVCWINNTIKSFQDCPWQELKEKSAKTLLETAKYTQPDGRPTAVLIAPGGPSVSQDGRYLAFHADVRQAWEGTNHTNPSKQHSIQKREKIDLQIQGIRKRKRGLFIAELEYPEEGDGLRIKTLVLPASA